MFVGPRHRSTQGTERSGTESTRHHARRRTYSIDDCIDQQSFAAPAAFLCNDQQLRDDSWACTLRSRFYVAVLKLCMKRHISTKIIRSIFAAPRSFSQGNKLSQSTGIVLSESQFCFLLPDRENPILTVKMCNIIPIGFEIDTNDHLSHQVLPE